MIRKDINEDWKDLQLEEGLYTKKKNRISNSNIYRSLSRGSERLFYNYSGLQDINFSDIRNQNRNPYCSFP